MAQSRMGGVSLNADANQLKTDKFFQSIITIHNMKFSDTVTKAVIGIVTLIAVPFIFFARWV
jgi:hypothetical protein